MRLRARILSPVSPAEHRWLPDAGVDVDEHGVIAAVGPWVGGSCDLDLRPGVLTPGFVDVHLHYPQARIVGSASGTLLPWLLTSAFPEEARFSDPEHAATAARAFAAALAAAGTTLCLAYSSVHPAACDALLTALDERGLRAIAGPVLMDHGAPDGLLLPHDQALPALEALSRRWHGRDGRFEIAVIPRFALSCTPAMLRGAGGLAARLGLRVSTHLAENTEEVAATKKMHHAADSLSVYEDAGLVVAGAVLAHCVHLSEGEWDRLAAAGAVVAHCPDSNDFLGSGGMPLAQVEARGVALGLGTDIAAGRSFRVPRIASSAHDNALRGGVRVPPERWLWAASRGGALALGHDHVGAIEPGLDADLVLHDLPAWVESGDDALGWLLFNHDAPPPRRTWVRGRQVSGSGPAPPERRRLSLGLTTAGPPARRAAFWVQGPGLATRSPAAGVMVFPTTAPDASCILSSSPSSLVAVSGHPQRHLQSPVPRPLPPPYDSRPQHRSPPPMASRCWPPSATMVANSRSTGPPSCARGKRTETAFLSAPCSTTRASPS